MNVDLEEPSDATLLARYVTEGVESAFSEVVRRHLPLVFSTALRRLGGDHAAAEDVAQAVFVALGLKAPRLVRHPALAGWLYTTAVHQASDQLRRRQRRQTHEHALMTNATPNSPAEIDWARLQPILDDALHDLRDEDRHAVVLRYFEQRPFPAIARELGLSVDAARMRVARALDKLRSQLAKRGVVSSAAALGAALAAQPPTNVPAGLAASIGTAIQRLPTASITAPALYGSSWKLTLAGLALFAAAGGARFLYLRQPASGHQAAFPPPASAGPSLPVRPHARLPFGRISRAPDAPVDPALTQGLSFLRSALFDPNLVQAEKDRLLQESAGLLVGYEAETLPLLRAALASTDPGPVKMAIEATGHFGLPLMRAIGPELLALLSNPEFKDPEQAMLAANRLISSLGPAGPKVSELTNLLRQRPEFSQALAYLLTAALELDPPRLADNRDVLSALLEDSNAELRDTAAKILAATPEPPPPLTAETVEKVTTRMRAVEPDQRQAALSDAWKLGRITPEIRDEMVERLQHDPAPSVRILARQALLRLAPDDPALQPPGADHEANRRDFLGRLSHNELSVPELLAALADRPAEIPDINQRLRQLGAAYWNAHGEEKISALQSLAALHRDPDVRIYESAATALESLDDLRPRTFFRFEELQPFFDTMAAHLQPGEYAIALRDLQPGVEAYWKNHGFLQPEPTHLSAGDLRILFVGPYHQNRPAFNAMLEAIQGIDPKFSPPTP